MTIQAVIEEKLAEALAPAHLEVVNESHQHNVPPDSETHFKVVVVADAFESQRKVARHQSVYALLADEMAGPVHALALHTYTRDEWADRFGEAPMSPPCLGGSKADGAGG
jgi:BolA protein